MPRPTLDQRAHVLISRLSVVREPGLGQSKEPHAAAISAQTNAHDMARQILNLAFSDDRPLIVRANRLSPDFFAEWVSCLPGLPDPWIETWLPQFIERVLRPAATMEDRLDRAMAKLMLLPAGAPGAVMAPLIASGVDPYRPRQNNGGLSHFTQMVIVAKTDVSVQWLLTNHPPGERLAQGDVNGWNALDWATIQDRVSTALTLIREGLDPHRPLPVLKQFKVSEGVPLKLLTDKHPVIMAQFEAQNREARAQESLPGSLPVSGRQRRRP